MHKGNSLQQAAPNNITTSILLPAHESLDTEQDSRQAEIEGLAHSTSFLSPTQSFDSIANSRENIPEMLIASFLPVTELTKFHFQLPLDSEIKELIAKPKDLLKHLCNVPVTDVPLEINWKDVVLGEKAFDEFLSFILLRLQYVYWKHEESHNDVIDVISELLVPSSRLFKLKLPDKVESLRLRLIFLFNMTQGVFESKKDLVLEVFPVLFSVTRMFAPFTENTEMIIKFIEQKFEEIVHSELFLRGAERYLQIFGNKSEVRDVVKACRNLNFTLFGIKTTTRVLGMVTPDGIALNLRHYLCQEDLEPRKSHYLVSIIHLLGQFIAKKFDLKMTVKHNEEEVFVDEDKGYLFQSIIFGDLIEWWRSEICRKKLIDVHKWPLILPLFSEDESVDIKKQKPVITCNSSMLLTLPLQIRH